MCACGCLLALGLAAGLAFCIMHSLWIGVAGLVALGCVIGWLSAKAMQKS